MAVRGPEPARPAPLKPPTTTTTKRPPPQPFDSAILIAKLEAHLREQDRKKTARHAAAQTPVFVPRTAAKHFASTTTPMPHAHPRKDSATTAPQPPPLDVDDKTVQAARSPGPSDAEEIPDHAARDATRTTVYRPGAAAQRNGHGHGPRPRPRQPLDDDRSPDEEAADLRRRPTLRADWAQASECGDAARHVFLQWRRVVRKASTGKAEAESGGENLVAEAVERIREERSGRRKSRVMGFFIKRP